MYSAYKSLLKSIAPRRASLWANYWFIGNIGDKITLDDIQETQSAKSRLWETIDQTMLFLKKKKYTAEEKG